MQHATATATTKNRKRNCLKSKSSNVANVFLSLSSLTILEWKLLLKLLKFL